MTDIIPFYRAEYILLNNKAHSVIRRWISLNLDVFKGDLEVRGVTSSPSPPLSRRQPRGSSFRRRAPHAKAILIATLSRLAPRTSAELTQLFPDLWHALASRPAKVTRYQTKGWLRFLRHVIHRNRQTNPFHVIFYQLHFDVIKYLIARKKVVGCHIILIAW